MSQTLFDDLEEGEIADDIPEPIVPIKEKPLPRRYVINDKKLKSRHRKRNRKHNSEHHKCNKSDFQSDSKLHKKTCPKHISLKHSRSPHSKKSNFKRDDFFDISLNHRESKHNHSKLPTLKSAFRNYRSPPRKVLKMYDSKVGVPFTSEADCPYPPFLSNYKKTQNEVNSQFKNISNLKNPSPVKQNVTNKNSSEKNDILIEKQRSSENLPPIEIVTIDESDDDDVDELRRLALATCSKRLPGVSSEVATDNYEVIDMEVDNEPENLNKNDDLFVIDTTPSYVCGVNGVPPPCPLDLNSNMNPVTNGIINGFLPVINYEDTYPNFSNDVFNQNLNNNLYTDFESEVNRSRLPASHLDDEFEEELLRAELIANLRSVRENNENKLPRNEKALGHNAGLESRFENEFTRIVRFKPDNYANSERIVSVESEIAKKYNVYANNSERIMSVESEIAKKDSVYKDNVFANNSERIVSVESEIIKKDNVYKDERTVSIVKDMVVHKDPLKNKSVIASFSNPNSPNANSPLRNAVDIKVKLNNVPSISLSSQNIVSLPQERLIISLTNDTSSDDSDEEPYQPVKPVAMPILPSSLEALISNARQESDSKKPPPPSMNGAPDALSCLSKAQQEEYNSLIKILAKKKEAPAQNLLEESKKAPDDANNILLKKKLIIAKQNYEKEKALLHTNMKELIKKKRAYMVSKIKTQQLKEQLNAAEKIRKANLQLWTNSSNQLVTLKKSLSKRQALIDSLQTKINTIGTETITNGLSPMTSNTPEQDFPPNS